MMFSLYINYLEVLKKMDINEWLCTHKKKLYERLFLQICQKTNIKPTHAKKKNQIWGHLFEYLSKNRWLLENALNTVVCMWHWSWPISAAVELQAPDFTLTVSGMFGMSVWGNSTHVFHSERRFEVTRFPMKTVSSVTACLPAGWLFNSPPLGELITNHWLSLNQNKWVAS